MAIKLTLITSNSCELAKQYTLENGKPAGSALAHMTSGSAKVVEIDKLEDLRDLLDLLTPWQAITAGVPNGGDTALTTRAGTEFNPDAVARTNEHFRYLDTPALFVIDVDTDSSVYRTVDEVVDALETSSPWLTQVVRVARPSASSFVGDRGLRGVHVYVAVTRGSDIPELAQRLQIDQWANGRGRVIISKSGALLVRQLSDASMYQPSRLMFEAPPVLGEGVTRVVPDEQAWLERAATHAGVAAKFRAEGGMLDVRLMPKLKDIDIKRFELAVRRARTAKKPDAKRVALDYHRANREAAGLEDGDVLGVQALRAMGDKVLPPSWPLVFERDGELLRGTVRQALGALDAVMGHRCADPFDATRFDLTPADLRAGEVVTMHGKPGIWSHKMGDFFAFSDSDALELSHPLELAAERLCGTIEEWPDRGDKKHSSVANLMFAVELLCRESKIKLQFDVCADTIVATDSPPIGMWVNSVTRLGASSVSVGTLELALDTVARNNPIDPWKDSILSLPLWDKTHRIDTLFTDLFAAPGSEALTGATQAFFAGLVMRQLHPGAPAPVVPVLIGGQAVDKSLFPIKLADKMGWPMPTPVAFSHDERKMAMSAARSPIAELAEMSGLGKREVEDVKRWTTDTQDVYRTPYGRREESHPRRFVLLGTANKNELNRDETGNRRFMPVMCEESAPLDWTAELPQILAEAKARFCQTWDEYIALIRRVPELVKAYNAEAMRQGIGTVKSDLDDLLPPILATLLKADERQMSVRSADIRNRLDQSHSGRRYDARAIAAWLKTRNWQERKNGYGLREYRAPEGWAAEPESPNVVPLSPFATAK
ncbi:VapE domain-containing protein [Xanthomonas euvesicatoria]|nr:hypothetical protein [Xanthomonas phage MYK3]